MIELQGSKGLGYGVMETMEAKVGQVSKTDQALSKGAEGN